MGEIETTLAPPNPEEPSSHETCGNFPAQEVAETFAGGGTDPQTAKADKAARADK